MTLPAFPVHGPSKRDRLLCCWDLQSVSIISEHGDVLATPANLGEVMDALVAHHAILLTTDDLASFEEPAMLAGWQVYRVGDDDHHGVIPKLVQISCRRGKDTGTIACANAWLDGEDREITVDDLRDIRALLDHLGVTAKATLAAISIETMRHHIPHFTLRTLPLAIHDDIYPHRRFPRAENIAPGTYWDLHEYDLTAAFASQLAAGVPNGAAIKTGSEKTCNNADFCLAHVRWRWTHGMGESPQLLRQDREDTDDLDHWHHSLLWWNIVADARLLGYDVELDPDVAWPAICWNVTSHAFAPWVAWINERAETAPTPHIKAWIKLIRNAGIGRFAMSRMEWRATLDPKVVMHDLREQGIHSVSLSDNNRIAYWRAPGRISDTRLLHIALHCWAQTDYEVWRIMAANLGCHPVAVYVDDIIFEHQLRVRPIGWHYTQLRGRHVVDDTRNIAGVGQGSISRHPGKKRDVA